MCFVKSSTVSVAPQVAQDPVERHKADASLTKHSNTDNNPKGYLQNVKTAPVGLTDTPQTEKKTLLGD